MVSLIRYLLNSSHFSLAQECGYRLRVAFTDFRPELQPRTTVTRNDTCYTYFHCMCSICTLLLNSTIVQRAHEQ